MGNWTNPNKVTFEDWIAKQSYEVKSDLRKCDWVKTLCQDAFEIGYKSGFDDAQYIASLNISEDFNG